MGRLPEFELTAVSAQTKEKSLRLPDLAGRAWVAGFVFTRCEGPCPRISATMARLQQDLPAGAGLLTFTVDPDRDDAKTLAAYAERLRADPSKWLFVTGPKAKLMPFLLEGFKLPAVEDPGAPSGRRVTHTTRLALIDGQGRLRGYFDSEDEVEVKRLIAAAGHLPPR